MSLKSEFEKAYDEWEDREKKLGTIKENLQIYTKVSNIKEILSKFIDGVESLPKKSYNDVYFEIKKLVDEIASDSIINMIDQLNCEGDIYVKKSRENKKKIKKRIKNFKLKFQKLEKSNFKKLKKFFQNEADSFSKNYSSKSLNEKSVFNTITNLSNFFSNICKIVCKFIEPLDIDKEFFYEKDKKINNFILNAIKRLLPNCLSKKIKIQNQKTDRHKIEPIKNHVNIFPQGKPLPREVKQAGVGDCYLMAALISLAKKNPQAITDCFIQGIDKVENEDNIDIRFFYLKKNETIPVVITVNKKKVIMPKYIKDGALWPKLIEKAYLIYRNKGYELLNGKYKKGYKLLNGGNVIDVMFAITGKKPKSLNYKKKGIISKIKSKLDKSTSLTCGFKKRFKIKDVKSEEEIQIYNRHAYAIIGIDENKKYVRLINPWKSGGRKAENSPKSKEGGHIAMSFKDFEDNFNKIKYTTNKIY